MHSQPAGTTGVSIFTLREFSEESRPTIIDDVISVDLFKRLNMQPIPILLIEAQKDAEWSGYCAPSTETQADEITIDMRILTCGQLTHRRKARWLLSVYLHECAHRLTPEHSHDAAFAAVCLLLYLRSGDLSGRPMFHDFSLFDIHDCFAHDDRAIEWAWKQASHLAGSTITAEECAQVIMQRHAQRQAWLASAPERENEHCSQKAKLAARWQKLQDRVVFWKRLAIAAIFLMIFSTYTLSARAEPPTIIQTQATSAAAEAEWERQKETTYVWTCDCIGGRPVWSLKSLKQVEREVQTKQAAVQRLMSTPQRVTMPGGATYQAPTLDYAAALALVSICK